MTASKNSVQPGRPLLVGVTGGLGSGKSSVCRMLRDMGCAVFEADRVAKELQVSDDDVVSGIRTMFGDDIYRHDERGRLQVDRRRIAEKAFSDPEVLRKLNDLMHPEVFKAFRGAVRDAKKKGVSILVKEAAILFESGGSKGLDVVIVVAADKEKRIERAWAKGMGSREDIQRRIEAQWPQKKLEALADYVIENNGTFSELEKSVKDVYRKLITAQNHDC